MYNQTHKNAIMLGPFVKVHFSIKYIEWKSFIVFLNDLCNSNHLLDMKKLNFYISLHFFHQELKVQLQNYAKKVDFVRLLFQHLSFLRQNIENTRKTQNTWLNC